MTINMAIVDFIAGALIWGQAAFFIPSVMQLYRDNKLVGMSIWTIGFYAFVSYFWVWVLILNDLPWSALGIAILALIETVWVIKAIQIKRAENV